MALIKSHLIIAIAEQNEFTKIKPTETILKIIKSTFESVEDIMISGFGKFCVKEKRERRGRNPVYLNKDYDTALYPEKDYHTLYFGEIVDCYEID